MAFKMEFSLAWYLLYVAMIRKKTNEMPSFDFCCHYDMHSHNQ